MMTPQRHIANDEKALGSFCVILFPGSAARLCDALQLSPQLFSLKLSI
jgi:hypothetical protein